jgi:hypothetical protein
MHRSRAAIGLLTGVAALAVVLPAFGQKSPQSLLPPGFNSPAPAPPPQPAAPPPPSPSYAAPPVPSQPAAPPGGIPTIGLAPPDETDLDAAAQAQDAADAANAANEAAEELRKQDFPEFARRTTDHVGVLSPDQTGIAEDGFGDASGAFLATLLRRLDAPIASRWVSMLLRRVLTTDIATPGAIKPGDWVAERVLLLTRMGEADAARLLAERVDPDGATPRFHEAVLQSALAAADPGALCPVAQDAETATRNRVPAWPLARAMCAGLSGEGGTASALVDRARSLGGAMDGIDLTLAERVVGAGTAGRRAVDIRWDDVNDLTPWRFGLASAVGLKVPDRLFDTGGLAIDAWAARAPMIPAADRLKAMRTAATLGVMSSADLVGFVSALAEGNGGDPYAMDDSPTGRLRKAYAARDDSDRVAALRALWADPDNERDLYADRILTARAAARITPASDETSDASALIASMLTAGLDTQAARWSQTVAGMRASSGDEAWALLAVGSPRGMGEIDADRVAGFGAGGRGSARLRAQFLLAGLAGLGRIDGKAVGRLSGELGVPLTVRNSWTRAIDAAAARHEPATVALLAAVGMQTTDWTQVSPVFLFHIVAALRSVGYEPEARMVAAEALMRT